MLYECDYDTLIVDKSAKFTHDDVRKIMSKVLKAGKDAGSLTKKGTLLLDSDGDLTAGIPFTSPPPRKRCRNFDLLPMVALKHISSAVYPGIDLVTTPSGKPVAMVYCNNCITDMKSYVSIIHEVVELMEEGGNSDLDEIYRFLYKKCLEGDLEA